MFLFTTSSPRVPSPANPVVDAIRQGAERTGTGFDYLLATAQRESALDPRAKAPTSSASGLFQFIEQTWLGVLKAEGPKHGLGDVANAIAVRGDGTLSVEDPKLRQRVLSLREDPEVAAVMAGAFTQRNREYLTAELGREPTNADLYVAHFLGARGAAELIRAAQRTPSRPAAADFPEAAAANRSIFYERGGKPRGAGEVYALLAAGHNARREAASAYAPEQAAPLVRADGPALHGLFRSDGRRGPISAEVAQLWQSTNASGSTVRTAGLNPFFPRNLSPSPMGDPAGRETAELSPPQASALPTSAPLPPLRPSSLASPRTVAEPVRHGAIPLDLSAFMKWRRA